VELCVFDLNVVCRPCFFCVCILSPRAPAVGQSPLVTTITGAAETLAARSPGVIADYASTLTSLANTFESSYTWDDLHASSWFTAAIHRLSMFVEAAALKDEWMGPFPNNGVFDVENAKDFSRFWSALQFIFCFGSDEMINGRELSNMAIFGEGWTWAGCMLLHVLGLRHRFEALNFTTFLHHVRLYHSTQFLPRSLVAHRTSCCPLEMWVCGCVGVWVCGCGC
jgi:hypothetical protein